MAKIKCPRFSQNLENCDWLGRNFFFFESESKKEKEKEKRKTVFYIASACFRRKCFLI